MCYFDINGLKNLSTCIIDYNIKTKRATIHKIATGINNNLATLGNESTAIKLQIYITHV